jgi:hypothetical protein
LKEAGFDKSNDIVLAISTITKEEEKNKSRNQFCVKSLSQG